MSFFTKLKSIGSKVRTGLIKGASIAQKGIDFGKKHIGNFEKFLDDVLHTAHNFPIIADIAHKLEENEEFKHFRDLLTQTNQFLDTSDRVVNNINDALTPPSGKNPSIENPFIPNTVTPPQGPVPVGPF
jgi:hypothetical protein